jgi:hypothetical protein
VGDRGFVCAPAPGLAGTPIVTDGLGTAWAPARESISATANTLKSSDRTGRDRWRSTSRSRDRGSRFYGRLQLSVNPLIGPSARSGKPGLREMPTKNVRRESPIDASISAVSPVPQRGAIREVQRRFGTRGRAIGIVRRQVERTPVDEPMRQAREPSIDQRAPMREQHPGETGVPGRSRGGPEPRPYPVRACGCGSPPTWFRDA